MSKAQLYIGTDQLDFNGEVNVKRQVNDIRDLSIGAGAKSYTFDIPLTRNNRRLLGNFQDPRSRVEVSDTAHLYFNGMEAISGKIRLLSANGQSVRAIIESDDWLDGIRGVSIQDLAWSSSSHALTEANVTGSWAAAAGALYRYPLINLSAPWTEETEDGLGCYLYPYDFIPAWNIEEIVRAAIEHAGYDLDSTGYFNGTEGQKKYLLGRPEVNAVDFIENKALKVTPTDAAENYDSDTVGDTEEASVTVNQVLHLTSEVTDEGSDFNTGTYRYTAPANGTYRFQARIYVITNAKDSNPDWDPTVHYLSWSIRVNGTPVVSFTDNDLGSPPTLFDGTGLFDLDTGWIHLNASQYVDVDVEAAVVATNQSGGNDTLEVYFSTGSYLQTTWDERNLWPGLNYTVRPSTSLPDIECVDFLKGLKEAYNLRFFVDRLNRTVYIETSDEFYGSTVIDWTDRIDYSQPIQLDSIASNHKEVQFLHYKSDNDDRAWTDYVNAYAAVGLPYSKQLTLDSEYVQAGVEDRENSVFYATAVGNVPQLGLNGDDILRIHGKADYVSYKNYPANRPKEWKPRLLNWDGEVTLFGGGYIYMKYGPEDSTTQYYDVGLASCDHYNSLYSDYWLKDYSRIEQNKVLTCTLRVTPAELTKFMTVVGTAANEGFRATYKIAVNGVDMYWLCSKVITDGNRVKAEFIQKL